MKLALSRSEEMVRYGPDWMIWNKKQPMYFVHARLELTPQEDTLFWHHQLNAELVSYEEEFKYVTYGSLIGGHRTVCTSIDEVVFTEQAITKGCEKLKARLSQLAVTGERIIDFD